MGAPNPLVTVEPFLPASRSHPGPVYECGEGVFQPVLAGKYISDEHPSLLVTRTPFGSSSCTSFGPSTTTCPEIISNDRIIPPSSSQPSSAVVLTPGCTPASLMGAPNPLVTVEPFLPAIRSHPGPVYECGEGVFQPVLAGNSSCTGFGPRTTTCPEIISNDRIIPPSSSQPSSAVVSTPGCTPASLMGAPNPLVTVEPLLPAIRSHPGPVYECGEGVFQPVLAGKYISDEHPSLLVTRTPFGSSFCTSFGPSTTTCPEIISNDRIIPPSSSQPSSAVVSTPGCTPASLMGAPNPLVTVEPFLPAIRSHPGPVYECGEGVFQPVLAGNSSCTGFGPRTTTCPEIISNDRIIPPSSSQPSSAVVSTPGCTPASLMEAPNLLVTVEPFLPATRSHPGPVYECGEGVFQAPFTGEYTCNPSNCLSVPVVPYSRISNTPSNTTVTNPVFNDTLLIYYQNAGGMNCDVTKYYLATSDGCYDVVVLTETWLDPRTTSSSVFGPDYEVFRCDRSPRNSRKLTGGGVLIAVKKTRRVTNIQNDLWGSVEQVWVRIQLSNRSIFLCGIYFPPDRIRDESLIDTHNLSIMSVVETASATDEIIVIGDFNLPGISWRSSCNGFLYPDVEHSSIHNGASKLLDCYSTATLRQINQVTNENNRCLDLCFVSAQEEAPVIIEAPLPLVKDVNHHKALVITLHDHQISLAQSISSVFYDFRKADHQSIIEYLAAIDWNDVLDERDVDIAARTLSHILGHIVDRHVPKKIRANNDHPWISRDLRRMKTTKRAALTRYSKYRTFSLREHYTRLNSAYKVASRLCFNRYQRKIQQNLKSKPQEFWRFVNEKRKESGLPTTMTLDEKVASTPDTICQLFAEKFSSIFCNETLPAAIIAEAANNVPLVEDTWANFVVDATMICDAAARLKTSTKPGPDGIPSDFLKKHIESLLIPILHVFNLSLSNGVFPSIWKTSTMFPVYKKGDRQNVTIGVFRVYARSPNCLN
ncbi:uncharacterized protein LOC134291840 isoform X3 [Aedes albopictus]|uniref:Endonuclease/exonuclease/phosphatase domain-containing protein n=1 Tax=Aedes albopictus TaxID=7160 RepID=A0ABM1YNU9_AEDAL